jgi:hypothetical protein
LDSDVLWMGNDLIRPSGIFSREEKGIGLFAFMTSSALRAPSPGRRREWDFLLI